MQKPRKRMFIFISSLLVCSLLLFIALIIGLATGYLGALVQWNTKPLPGNPQAFDVSKYFHEIHEYAGKETRLEKFYLKYVKSDGTIDLYAEYNPKADFYFIKGESEDGGAIGAPRNYSEMERITIAVERPWTRAHHSTGSGNYNIVNRGLRKGVSNVSSEPNCPPIPRFSIKKLWEKAIELKAPGNAVAEITYDKNGYYFEIDGFGRLDFDFNLHNTSVWYSKKKYDH